MTTIPELAKYYRNLNFGFRIFAIVILWFFAFLAYQSAIRIDNLLNLHTEIHGDMPKPKISVVIGNLHTILIATSCLFPLIGTFGSILIKNPASALILIAALLVLLLLQLIATICGCALPFIPIQTGMH